MSIMEIKKSIALINLNIFLKNITNDHIVLKNGKIHKISNLTYDKNIKNIKITYDKKLNIGENELDIDPRELTNYNVYKHDFTVLWMKYIDTNII